MKSNIHITKHLLQNNIVLFAKWLSQLEPIIVEYVIYVLKKWIIIVPG